VSQTIIRKYLTHITLLECDVEYSNILHQCQQQSLMGSILKNKHYPGHQGMNILDSNLRSECTKSTENFLCNQNGRRLFPTM